MRLYKRIDKLEVGETVIFHDRALATVVANWTDLDRPTYNLVALRNDDTGSVAELRVLASLKVEVVSSKNN